MLDCILPRLFRLFFVLLALLVAAPASRADTTTWRWLESSSGAIRLLRYSGGSVAPTVFWSGAPTASPVILSDGSSGMQSVLDAVVTYLFPPPAFNSVNSLLGDLAATLAAASASLAPVGGAVVQQIDTRTWRLLSRDNAPSQVLASGANTLSTAAADIVLCAPSLPVWRTALRCAASSGLVALDFASGATIDYTDTSSASIAFNFTLTLPYSVAAVGTLAAAPQSLVDLLALVAFRARQMREAAASIGTVLSANDARAGPAKVIAILFWTFLAASTLAFLCISAILQAWRLPCLAAFPFSFWLGIALSIAALAILGGGVTGWATLVFLCFVHIAVVCIMYCCRVDFCWPLFLRKCPALCCIKIADTSVVVDENSAPPVASSDIVSVDALTHTEGFSLFALKRAQPLQTAVDPSSIAAAAEAAAAAASASEQQQQQQRNAWIADEEAEQRAAAEAAAAAEEAAAAATRVELQPACPERFSVRQQQQCGGSVVAFFALLIIMVALVLLLPLPLYSVYSRSTGSLITEFQPDILAKGVAVSYSIDSVASYLQMNVWFRASTTLCGSKFNQPLATDADKYAAIYVDYIALYAIDMSPYARPLYSQYSSVNDWFYRRLATGARTISGGDHVLTSPADSRVLVFPSISADVAVWLKNSQFSVQTMLGPDQSSTAAFVGGSMVIARLAPSDYHRYHAPSAGTIISQYFIDGTVYSVNADAIRSQNSAIYNQRGVTVIANATRRVAFVSVGATCVGSVNWSNTTGAVLAKGDEVGYFAFGGSTIVLLFPPNSVRFDDDLILASSRNVETLMSVGNSIGTWLI